MSLNFWKHFAKSSFSGITAILFIPTPFSWNYVYPIENSMEKSLSYDILGNALLSIKNRKDSLNFVENKRIENKCKFCGYDKTK